MLINMDLLNSTLEVFRQRHKEINSHRLVLASMIPQDARILEVGAGAGSVFSREKFPNYRVLDFYTTEEINPHFSKDYGISGLSPNDFPEVDYSCKNGLLSESIKGDRFDLVYSSHAIEHQPCLITHLLEIEKILAEGGVVAFVVPTLKCTFDALRQHTTTADVLAKYHSKEKMPSGANVFDYYARHVTLNPGREITIEDDFSYSFPIELAYDKFKKSLSDEGQYDDIHNWTFTPDSFVLLMLELYLLNVISIFPKIITPVSYNEFLCVMCSVPERTSEILSQLHAFRLHVNKSLMLGR